MNERWKHSLETQTKTHFLFLDCSSPQIGDGYCDDRFNLPLEGKMFSLVNPMFLSAVHFQWKSSAFTGCGFDGGDCCGQTVNTLFCEHCLCLDNVTLDSECRHSKVRQRASSCGQCESQCESQFEF